MLLDTAVVSCSIVFTGANTVLTDKAERLGILKENVKINTESTSPVIDNERLPINSIKLNSQQCNTNTMYSSLRGEDNSHIKEKDHVISVKPFDWSDRDGFVYNEQWDVVIGSDIIYIESSFDDLLYTMRHLKCSMLLLSCRLRYAKDHKFIKRAKEFFDVNLLLYDESRDIRLFTFTLHSS